MKKKYRTTLTNALITLACFSSSIAFSENTTATGETTEYPIQANATNTPDEANHVAPNKSTDVQLLKDLCPSPEKLIFNTVQRTWSAPKGWKALQTSFLQTIDGFIGAQWVGVGIGQVICIYTKTGKDTFPVTLQRGLLVPAPTVGHLWVTSNGYMGCKSHDVNDCPFFVQIPKPIKNVYDELNFKDKPKNNQP